MVGRELCWLLLAFVAATSSCFSVGISPDPPARVGFIPHIETVEKPTTIKRGVPATFTLHLSTSQNPQLLDEPLEGHQIFALHRSKSFVAGSEDGSYSEGLFRGMVIDPAGAFGPATSMGTASATAALSVTFEEAGEQVLYIGHAVNPAAGGLEVSELVLNSGFPPEGSQIEYLPVQVTVEP